LVALAPDAKRLAVVDSRSMVVQNPRTRTEFWRRDVALAPMALAFSPDGSMLAASDYLGVHLLNARTGKPIRDLLKQRARMVSLDFSADGRVLAAGSEGFGFGNTVRVWETTTGKRPCNFKVPHDRTAYVALSADGKTLACWGTNMQEGPFDSPGARLQLWDIKNNRMLRQIPCGGQIWATAFSADGKKLAVSAAGAFQQLPRHELFDAATGKALRTLELEARGMIHKLTFSPDGSVIAGIAYGSEILFWETATSKVSSGAAGPTCQPQGVLFAGRQAYAFGSSGSEVHVWDARTGELLHQVSGHTGPVGSIAFVNGGKRIISEARGREIRLWDGADGNVLRGFVLDPTNPGRDTVGGSVSRVSPSGKFVLSWKFQSSTAQLFDASSGRKLRDVGTSSGKRPPLFSFSSDDQALLVQGPDPKPTAADLYETSTGKLVRHFQDSRGELLNVAVSPDHRLVALAIGTGQLGNNALACDIDIVNAQTGKAQCSLSVKYFDSYVPPMAFAPDGDYLVVRSIDPPETELLICDVRSGKRLCALPSASMADQSCISPDGRTVVAVTHDYKNQRSVIQVWEACSGSTRRGLEAGIAGISALAFSPDGRRVAAGCHDSTILVWDVAEKLGNPSQSLSQAKSAIWAELASPDGSRAYQAMKKLYAAPRDAVDLIRSNLKPVTARVWTQAEIADLLRKLDSRRFRERTQASVELGGLGESAVPLLRKALQSTESPEVRERLRQLLDKIGRARFAPDMIRPLRALEVLEHINSSESREALKAYAAGSADAPLTKYARGAVERLARARADK
jgi:WD40 repeat protein